ncbi:hypothetical protein QE369_003523 [Agrobacterium larrymoorei]|uniref:Nucleotidyl transferase AbiEii/AbiGii toxin family protein n=1 Tax=Agrobacterium larrymoorei TaxID=160699 RepID=A0AAJ2BI05_9HYPH|nr:nucleotidyl transferase AbiEii/AbiGii toxin family protein [Agrobacterium larrymoorei]MDR6103326.1 hypothetical protein [Agrobacterium larrymoorei]
MTLFRRPHHNAVLTVLNALDGALLERAECFFGGGTAIVLSLDEYRESVDIDLLCASQEGYRLLREAVWSQQLSGLTKVGAQVLALREMRADQYGIRTFVQVEDARIKLEIVREGRIDLSGQMDARYGVPVLDRSDMFAEKLLANADRWPDKAVYSRDIIDLSMMIAQWGEIPVTAWQKARGAYGDTVDRAYAKAVALIQDRDWLTACMDAMQMDRQLAPRVLSAHVNSYVDGKLD